MQLYAALALDKTIINAGQFAAFQTVNETSTPGSYANDAD